MINLDVAARLTSLLDAARGTDAPGFDTAMVHLYRGEMHRMTVWRQRLDITSNWGILLTVALATFALGSMQVPHYTLLLGLTIIGISILIEARRYRHVHHSNWRLYLIEVGYFSELLSPSDNTYRQVWRTMLAEDLRHPRQTISWFLATRARLRRNYLLLFYFLEVVWFTKLFIHPNSPNSGAQFLARFAVGDLIPSWLVALTAAIFIVVATLLALTCPTLEELEDWSSQIQVGSASSRGDSSPAKQSAATGA
jgi:uncharacterized membrane protein